MPSISPTVVGLLSTHVSAHGSLTYPPPRTNMTQEFAGNCANGVYPGPGPVSLRLMTGDGPQNGPCDWYNQGCQAGCKSCNIKCGHAQAAFGLCCDHPIKPTVTDPKMRTFQDFAGSLDVGFKFNPWRSPGHAPVIDPCGIAGGNEPNAEVKGIPPGTSGLSLPPNPTGASWKAGSTQEVSWSLFANHGGGYSYRLCPISKNTNVTEQCFAQHPLQFVGDTQWIQFGGEKSNRTAIEARRTTTGTYPEGSQWTRNPIPACGNSIDGQAGGAAAGKCHHTQFEPPMQDVIMGHPKFAKSPGLYGFGPGSGCAVGADVKSERCKFWKARFNFNIIDQVQIPANLKAGDYLLGFRWDAEQTPQVWANCADVTVTN